jgi:hypothetical protein
VPSWRTCPAPLFVLWLVESLRWYHNDMSLPVGLNLEDSIVWVATCFPSGCYRSGCSARRFTPAPAVRN